MYNQARKSYINMLRNAPKEARAAGKESGLLGRSGTGKMPKTTEPRERMAKLMMAIRTARMGLK